jgi:hypothetical protein
MLLGPSLIGVVAAGRWNLPSFLFIFVALSLYLARYPLVLWVRSRFERFPQGGLFTFVSSLGLGLLLGGLLVFTYGLYLMPLLGLVGGGLLVFHLVLVRYRRERTWAGEFLGIGTLALSAPAAYYASTGILSVSAFLLWILSIAYFGTTVFYVRMRLAYSSTRTKPRGGGQRLVLPLAVYQAAVLGSVSLVSSLGLLPPLTPLAFLPIAAQVAVGTMYRKRGLSIKRLGFILLGQSVAFVLLMAAAFGFHGQSLA